MAYAYGNSSSTHPNPLGNLRKFAHIVSPSSGAFRILSRPRGWPFAYPRESPGHLTFGLNINIKQSKTGRMVLEMPKFPNKGKQIGALAYVVPVSIIFYMTENKECSQSKTWKTVLSLRNYRIL